MAKTEAYISFITDHLKKGTVTRKALLSKFGKKWQVSDRTFDRAWKIAIKEFTEYQNKLQQQKDAISIELEKEAFKQGIIDKNKRMEILSQIALGNIPLKKPIVVDKIIESIDVVPDYADRRAAIAELNKMDGSYSPTQIQDVTKEKQETWISQFKKKND